MVDALTEADFSQRGPWQAPLPTPPAVNRISAPNLKSRLAEPGDVAIIDLSLHAAYRQGHLPGAWFAQRSRLAEAIENIPPAGLYVLTCTTSQQAEFAVPELAALVSDPVVVLTGGNKAWRDAGFALDTGSARIATPPIDRYRRPYEGTDNPREAMQGYLDWEYGLVEQLGRDGTHGFFVI